MAELKWLPEIEVKNRIKGNYIWFKLGMAFWSKDGLIQELEGGNDEETQFNPNLFFVSALRWTCQLDHPRIGPAIGAIDLLSERAAVKTGQDAPWEVIDALKRMRNKG